VETPYYRVEEALFSEEKVSISFIAAGRGGEAKIAPADILSSLPLLPRVSLYDEVII
jgi:hypothetical protein